MQKQLLSLLSIAFLSLLLTACGKEKDPAPAKTKTELITQSSWKYDSSNPDVFTSVPQLVCYKDNIITFSSNGSATMSEGTTICTTPPQTTYTWSFQSNETILALNAALFPGGSPNFTLVTLNETTLVVSQQVTTPIGPVNVVVTFKH